MYNNIDINRKGTKDMLEKLAEIEQRYEQVASDLTIPECISNQEKYRELMKELKKLEPVVEKYREYKSCLARIRDAEELLSEGIDAELKKLAQDEIGEAKELCRICEEQLTSLLLSRDPNDDKNVIVEIRGGAGGEEAALFAASLYRMYSMYAATHKYKTEIISANETELGGFKEISFSVEGAGAYSRFKYESGVHRVQRVPETEAQGRIHTSTVTVAVLTEAEEIEIEINPADLQIETCKSSGAGGQHINKTESAIRIIHKPSGFVVECQEERSQLQNREKAMKLLRARLYDMEKTKRDLKIASDRKSQVGTGDRSERVRTYNFPQGRVTDHRIGLTLYSIDSIMDGVIDELIDALSAAETAEKLKGSKED